jgi:hypothetical protein
MLHEQYAIVEDTVYGRSYWLARIASAVEYKLSISGVARLSELSKEWRYQGPWANRPNLTGRP